MACECHEAVKAQAGLMIPRDDPALRANVPVCCNKPTQPPVDTHTAAFRLTARLDCYVAVKGCAIVLTNNEDLGAFLTSIETCFRRSAAA